MIIGISGKIGHGKDTLGNLIVKQTMKSSNKIIEDEFGNSLMNNYGNYITEAPKPTWEIRKFAVKLKQIASILTGIPIEKFEDQDFKDSFLGPEWNQPIFGRYGDGSVYAESTVPMKVRTFLQLLGTEAMRFGLHKDVWINALFADYDGCPKCGEKENLHYNHDNGKQGNVVDTLCNECGTLFKPSNWVITDVRFPNEAKAIKERGGIIVRVDRGSGFVSSDNWKGEGGTHTSEFMLDDYPFDAVYRNDGTIEELAEFAKKILHNIKLQK